jgi:signal transduction histidine kinase
MSETISLDTPVLLMRRLAHDLRSLIASIKINNDILLQGIHGELNTKQNRTSKRIQHTSSRMIALLDDLMAYVKAEANEYPVSIAPFDPRELLDDVYEEIRSFAESKNLHVELKVDESVPPTFVGAEEIIRRILMSLLWNAVGFTEQGSVSIEADWGRDGGWTIFVCDTGIGIAPEDASHVFEPFWQGDVSVQTPTAGFGMGLAAASALTRSVAGELFIHETSEAGTVFCLRLPLRV